MKKVMIMLSVAALPLWSVAQGHAHKQNEQTNERRAELSPDERARKEAERMGGQLGLTSEQKQQWEQAALDRMTANQPLKDKMRGSTTPEERASLRQEMRKNGEAFDKKTETILTIEQKQKYSELKKNRKDTRRGKRH